MFNSIVQAQCVNLKELEHLFIDLEYFKVQNKTFNVYRSRSFNQKNKKYLQLEEIKHCLLDIDKKNLKYIYLIGKNSMAHPEFNHILRFCLTFCPVTIFSDGTCINDKKSRFLKRVEEEGSNEIIFKIFINHYDEKINDEISGRGSFRKALHAITSLNKYGFNPILVIKTEKEKITDLKEGFSQLGQKFGFETEDINFSFIPYESSRNNEAEHNSEKLSFIDSMDFDCMHSRILSKTGIYNCPLLLNDYRGHSGVTLKNFSKRCYLETEKCRSCMNYGKLIFVNSWV